MLALDAALDQPRRDAKVPQQHMTIGTHQHITSLDVPDKHGASSRGGGG